MRTRREVEKEKEAGEIEGKRRTRGKNNRGEPARLEPDELKPPKCKKPKKAEKPEVKTEKRTYRKTGLFSKDPLTVANARATMTGLPPMSSPSASSSGWMTPGTVPPLDDSNLLLIWMCVCFVADNGQTSKMQELQNKVKIQQADLARLQAQLDAAEQAKNLAIATRVMELQKEKYDAVESAMKAGYQRALDNLKELRGFTSGFN